MLRRIEKLIKSDASQIVGMIMDTPVHNFNEFLDELVKEGVVEVTELPDGLRAYSAQDGPSLYGLVQERILRDLYEDGKIS